MIWFNMIKTHIDVFVILRIYSVVIYYVCLVPFIHFLFRCLFIPIFFWFFLFLFWSQNIHNTYSVLLDKAALYTGGLWRRSRLHKDMPNTLYIKQKNVTQYILFDCVVLCWYVCWWLWTSSFGEISYVVTN